jgi:hypothetical protein
MGLLKLVRKDLFLCTAVVTFAGKGFQVLEAFPSRAMLGCRGHDAYPSSTATDFERESANNDRGT